MRTVLKNNWASLLIVAGVTAYAYSIYPELPEKMATHFNWGAQPDGFMDKRFALPIFPVLMLFVALLVPFLVRISPKGFTMELSQGSIARINFTVVLTLAILYVGVLLKNLRPEQYSIVPFIHLTCIVFLICFGNFLSKIERNFFIGIRTPWALVSEKNWFATHRFAAKFCVTVGLLLAVAVPLGLPPGITVFAMAGAIFVPVLYSYWFFRHYEREPAHE